MANIPAGNSENIEPVFPMNILRVNSTTITRPSDTNAYAAGDVIASSTSAPDTTTFTNMVRFAGGSGTIVGVSIVDSAYVAVSAQFELWLFDGTYTQDNDNEAFTPTDAEMATVVAVIPMSAGYVGTATAGTNGNAIFPTDGLSIPFRATGTSLVGALVVRNAYVPIASEVFTISVKVLWD